MLQWKKACVWTIHKERILKYPILQQKFPGDY